MRHNLRFYMVFTSGLLLLLYLWIYFIADITHEWNVLAMSRQSVILFFVTPPFVLNVAWVVIAAGNLLNKNLLACFNKKQLTYTVILILIEVISIPFVLLCTPG